MNKCVLENKTGISKDWKEEKCSFKHFLIYTRDCEEGGMEYTEDLRHQSWGQISSSFPKGCLGEADNLIPKQLKPACVPA